MTSTGSILPQQAAVPGADRSRDQTAQSATGAFDEILKSLLTAEPNQSVDANGEHGEAASQNSHDLMSSRLTMLPADMAPPGARPRMLEPGDFHSGVDETWAGAVISSGTLQSGPSPDPARSEPLSNRPSVPDLIQAAATIGEPDTSLVPDQYTSSRSDLLLSTGPLREPLLFESSSPGSRRALLDSAALAAEPVRAFADIHLAAAAMDLTLALPLTHPASVGPDAVEDLPPRAALFEKSSNALVLGSSDDHAETRNVSRSGAPAASAQVQASTALASGTAERALRPSPLPAGRVPLLNARMTALTHEGHVAEPIAESAAEPALNAAETAFTLALAEALNLQALLVRAYGSEGSRRASIVLNLSEEGVDADLREAIGRLARDFGFDEIDLRFTHDRRHKE